MDFLLINQDLAQLQSEIQTVRNDQFVRLIEQCRKYETTPLSPTHPPTSITYMGMAAANLSLAYLLTHQEHYLVEAKRWIFTAVDYDVWGYGFLVDVDLSASWLLYGLGLSYDWLKDDLTPEERERFRAKLELQGRKMYAYGEEDRGNCWSTDYYQNHNWINYTGLLTTAYAIRDESDEAATWIATVKDNFDKVFDYLPEDGSNYEGTGYWRYAINFFLTAAELIRKFEGVNHFQSEFMKNTFYYRLYQSAPNWEENINFSDVHDRRSSHSIGAYYKIAAEYDNGHAQWLAEKVRKNFLFREAYESTLFPGILPEAFLELIWFNPEIAQMAPDDLPLTRYFEDLGLVTMRSSWDNEATHLSFKSSPAGGHKQWKTTWELDEKFGWRTRSLTHYHVDFNNFILIHNGASLAIDEGFNRTSRAEIHNLITVDGTGCVGEKIWEDGDLSDPVLFDLNCKGIHNVWRDVPKEAVANVESFTSDDDYVHVVGEASKMYYPEMQLTRNARHIINSQLGYFIVIDELKSELAHTYTWRMHSEQFAVNTGEDCYQVVDGKGVLDIHTIHPQNTVKSIDETIVEEIMTPQRPDDKRRISLKTLKVENSEKSNDLVFITVLAPHDFFGGESLSIERIDGDDCQGMRVTGTTHTEVFLFSPTGELHYEDIALKGSWVSIVKDSQGEEVKRKLYVQ